ncbi:hypothetical protein DYB32_002281 [Aphanomyces invadans]|uniref:N-acetyltransferase domain-containing protein n=1 Tax=Aphanomyces invadans TaxID=157072 RepID=A0A3R7D4B4_9STRA|nr:hypothetical protein DYB32_002281 [Aphanomyces invadans]
MTATSPTIQAILDAQAFLDRTLSLRRHDPIGTNQIASIAIAIATGARSPDGIQFFVVGAVDDTRECNVVKAFAMYSTSRGVFLSPAMTPDEASAVGEHVAITVEPLLFEVTGSNAATTAFNAAYCRNRRSLTTPVWQENLLSYVLGTLRLPLSVAGTMRVASAEHDSDLVTAWSTEFFEYIGAPAQDAVPFAAAGLRRQAIFLWEVEGKPVGFAGFAPPVTVEGETVYRIGPVFVSSTERRKGYASGLTAALSQHLQAMNTSRSSRVCLFADAANPASNKAYQNVGFELHSQSVAYSFTTIAGATT